MHCLFVASTVTYRAIVEHRAVAANARANEWLDAVAFSLELRPCEVARLDRQVNALGIELLDVLARLNAFALEAVDGRLVTHGRRNVRAGEEVALVRIHDHVLQVRVLLEQQRRRPEAARTQVHARVLLELRREAAVEHDHAAIRERLLQSTQCLGVHHLSRARSLSSSEHRVSIRVQAHQCKSSASIVRLDFCMLRACENEYSAKIQG